MRKSWCLLCVVLLTAGLFAQGPPAEGPDKDKDKDKGKGEEDAPLRTGYAIVTTVSGPTAGLVVFETFGHNKGNETTQAGLLPSDMTRSATLFVSASGNLARNLGVAIANPGGVDAEVSLALRNEEGVLLGQKVVTVPARRQMAQFVTEMFVDKPDLPKDLTGTLQITSPAPVAVVGLRFRGANFSTLPTTNLTTPTAVPEREPGVGGAGAVILPHFASGGGWATELVLANVAASPLTVRVDLYQQDGSPLAVRLNGGEPRSSYTGLLIPAGGVLTLSPRDSKGNSPF